jgi:integrase
MSARCSSRKTGLRHSPCKPIRDRLWETDSRGKVIQYLEGQDRGRPYFLCADSTRSQAFAQAVARTVPSDAADGLSVHSLRHMYGTYLLNYLPRSDGTYGLPIGLVKQLMGHASISSTSVYARHDLDLIEAELEYANSLVLGGTTKSFNEMKLQALQGKVAQVEAAITNEQQQSSNSGAADIATC